MTASGRLRVMLVASGVALGLSAGTALVQEEVLDPARNSLPNPTKEVVTGWGSLPDGRMWGMSAGVDIDPDGNIWAYDRCGANTCAESKVDPILKFDRSSGRLLTKFGGGMFVFPHGFYVDRDGNVWVTDGQGNKERTKGHQVFKFTPHGKVLMTLGKAGVPGNGPDTFNEPNDVVTAPNGDIFVSDGHSGQYPKAPPDANARIVKFTRDGKYIKEWGKLGSAPGEFRTPHSLAFDSRGRLFVADRGNHRIQIFDQDGKFLEETKVFSRISGVFIDKNDTLYAADSESSVTSHPGFWKRGIRVGSARDLTVQFLIPDPANPDPTKTTSGTSAAEGVAVDAAGNVYGAEVGPRQVMR